MHLRGHRGVVDQFDQFVAEYHRSRRGAEIVADRKTAAVDHPDLAGAPVFGPVLEARQQALAVGLVELADRHRVGEEIVGRGERVEPLAHPERGAPPVVFGHCRRIVDGLPDPAGIEQVPLLEQVVVQVVVPFGGVEARVAFGRLEVILLLEAESAAKTVHLQRAGLARELVDRVQPFLRMLCPGLLRLKNRSKHAEGIEYRLQGAREVRRCRRAGLLRASCDRRICLGWRT